MLIGGMDGRHQTGVATGRENKVGGILTMKTPRPRRGISTPVGRGWLKIVILDVSGDDESPCEAVSTALPMEDMVMACSANLLACSCMMRAISWMSISLISAPGMLPAPTDPPSPSPRPSLRLLPRNFPRLLPYPLPLQPCKLLLMCLYPQMFQRLLELPFKQG